MGRPRKAATTYYSEPFPRVGASVDEVRAWAARQGEMNAPPKRARQPLLAASKKYVDHSLLGRAQELIDHATDNPTADMVIMVAGFTAGWFGLAPMTAILGKTFGIQVPISPIDEGIADAHITSFRFAQMIRDDDFGTEWATRADQYAPHDAAGGTFYADRVNFAQWYGVPMARWLETRVKAKEERIAQIKLTSAFLGNSQAALDEIHYLEDRISVFQTIVNGINVAQIKIAFAHGMAGLIEAYAMTRPGVITGLAGAGSQLVGSTMSAAGDLAGGALKIV